VGYSLDKAAEHGQQGTKANPQAPKGAGKRGLRKRRRRERMGTPDTEWEGEGEGGGEGEGEGGGEGGGPQAVGTRAARKIRRKEQRPQGTYAHGDGHTDGDEGEEDIAKK